MAAKTDKFQWGKARLVQLEKAKLKFSSMPSPDHGALTLLFSNFGLDIAKRDSEDSKTRLEMIDIPMSLPDDQGLVGYTMDVRFFVQKDPAVRALTVLDLAGSLQTIEFAFDEAANGDYTRTVVGLERRSPKEQAPAAFRRLTPCHLSIYLALQRRDPKAGGLIQVDSIDISLVR